MINKRSKILALSTLVSLYGPLHANSFFSIKFWLEPLEQELKKNVPTKEFVDIDDIVKKAFPRFMSQYDKKLCAADIQRALLHQLGTLEKTDENTWKMAEIIDQKIAEWVGEHIFPYIFNTLDGNDKIAQKIVSCVTQQVLAMRKSGHADVSLWVSKDYIDNKITQELNDLQPSLYPTIDPSSYNLDHIQPYTPMQHSSVADYTPSAPEYIEPTNYYEIQPHVQVPLIQVKHIDPEWVIDNAFGDTIPVGRKQECSKSLMQALLKEFDSLEENAHNKSAIAKILKHEIATCITSHSYREAYSGLNGNTDAAFDVAKSMEDNVLADIEKGKTDHSYWASIGLNKAIENKKKELAEKKKADDEKARSAAAATRDADKAHQKAPDTAAMDAVKNTHNDPASNAAFKKN